MRGKGDLLLLLLNPFIMIYRAFNQQLSVIFTFSFHWFSIHSAWSWIFFQTKNKKSTEALLMLHFYILYMQHNMFTFKTVASNSRRKHKKLVFISDFKKLLQCKHWPLYPKNVCLSMSARLHVDFVEGISVNKYWNNQFEPAIQHNPNINGERPEFTLDKYLLQHRAKKRSIFSVQNSLWNYMAHTNAREMCIRTELQCCVDSLSAHACLWGCVDQSIFT